MKNKEAFIDALDLQQDEEGHWFVNGSVYGRVYGSVYGRVYGSVYSDVGGSVKGKINGREWKFVEENNDEG